MKDYVVFSLGELLEEKEIINEENLKIALSDFTCEREKDLEDFLNRKAISYDKSKLGQTSLIVDKEELLNGNFVVMAFFTISFTSIDISEMSKSKKKRILGNVPGRERLNNYHAFLIGQLGRSDKYDSSDISGETILRECYHEIYKAQRVIGGRLLLLECREHMYDLFYKKQGFEKLSDELDNGLYTLYTRLNFE